MLLTVFGMLSEEMVIKDKGNIQASRYLQHALFSDYCFKTRKHCLKQGASILACNIVAVLLVPFWRDNGHWLKATTFCVTYSCATARELHTVPY